MDTYFKYDARLGIALPYIETAWEALPLSIQKQIVFHWEMIRGTIPDRIWELEQQINQKQETLNNEANFERSCQLNSEIAELASTINDLWLWYRTNQQISTEKSHQ